MEPKPTYQTNTAYTDTRLANLNTALDLVARLTADTSLTIDVVGPLARALGMMEDAKKALTKRQDYINWLRDYQDDDGRRWTDLSDNQTWHKNSPCHQAFVKAFPKEDFVKSALMDAKTQLEKEAAVSDPWVCEVCAQEFRNEADLLAHQFATTCEAETAAEEPTE